MAETILDQIVAPLSTVDFVRDVWEQRPCRLGLRDVDLLWGCMTREDLGHLIGRALSQAPSSLNVLHHGGPPVDVFPVDTASCMRLLGQGRSLRVSEVERLVPSIADLCTDVSSFVGCFVSANLYWTPASSQALPIHLDGHSVFVIQLLGAKEWRIFGNGVQWPLEDAPSMRKYESPRQLLERIAVPQDIEDLESKPVVLSPTLLVGDVLYLPRGTYHCASTQSQESVHVTIGIHTHSYLDMLSIALAELSKKQPYLRASMPVGFTRGTDPRQLAEHSGRSLLETLPIDSKIGEAGRILSELARRRLHADCAPAQRREAVPIAANTVLRRCPGTPAYAEVDGERAVLVFRDVSVEGPLGLLAAFEFLATHTSLAPGEIPGLPTDKAIHLASALQRRGFFA